MKGFVNDGQDTISFGSDRSSMSMELWSIINKNTKVEILNFPECYIDHIDVVFQDEVNDI